MYNRKNARSALAWTLALFAFPLSARCIATKQDRPILVYRFQDCSDSERKVAAGTLLTALREGRSIDLENAIVEDSLDIGRAGLPIEESSGSISRVVKGWLSFRHCAFSSFLTAGREPVHFKHPVTFDHCTFHGYTIFDNCTFDGNLSFDRSNVSEDFSLQSAVLKQDLRFFGTSFGESDDNSTFVKLDGSSISGNLAMQNARVHFPVTTRGIQVGKTTDLQYAHFWLPVTAGLNGEDAPVFWGDVDARNASFAAELKLPNTIFHGEVLFDDAEFSGDALDLHSSTFDKRVRLSARRLPKKLNLEDTVFRSSLDMERSEPSRVQQVTLSERTQVSAVRLNWRAWNPGRAWWWEPFVPPTDTVFSVQGGSRDTILSQWLAAVASGLIEQGRTAEANEVAYRKAKLGESYWGKVVGDWLFGHGLRLSNPAALFLAAGAFFALLFRRFRIYHRAGDEISLHIGALPLTLQTEFLPGGFCEGGLRQQFMLSLALLTKLSFGAKYLTYRKESLAWAKLEWVLGLALMAAVTVCVAKNFPELKELLHGIIG